MVRPSRARSHAAPLHRSATARIRALGQAKGALLPLRGDHDRAFPFAGAVTFLLFPAAPPWAAGEKGLLPGLIRIPHNPAPDPSGAHGYHAISVSKLIDPNPYAAIPSLHAGYAFLCFLFVVTLVWKTRWRWWALCVGVLYPLAQSFAVVYTGNHYVVDLMIGYLYAIAALAGVWWLWRRWRLPA
ncbi:MAG: phosphatase PAP2 family protein [Actinobacteria bacterium]|nr:MAG: phosphatase PAP2 family protein [Actinomycetota bacterium]